MTDILQKHGIISLTGEACTMYMRLLCDLTPEGVEVIERFFGGTIKCVEGSNWNSSQGQVASIMLPYSCLDDLRKFIIHLYERQQSDRNTHQMSGREI